MTDNDIATNNTLGLQCLEHGLFREAIGWFGKILDEFDQLGISDPVTLFNLGIAHQGSGQFAQAIEFYLRSLVIAPQYDLTRTNLSACIEPCLAAVSEHNEPNIARLLLEFKDKMGWPDVVHNPSSTKQFLHFMKAAYLCKADSIVLDISAGFCRNKPFFEHAQYVSLDLEVATDPGFDFSELDLVGDALNLPIKDNSIDLIISSSSLEHYNNPFKAFHGFSRILKPGGHLYLDVPFTHVEHQIPHDYFRFSRYGLNHLCKEYGLIVESIVPDSTLMGSGYRMFKEALEVHIQAELDENTLKTMREALNYLDQVIKPIIPAMEIRSIRNGVENIQNCTQYPVRYNLIARKPGALNEPEHFANRAELLKDIAECPSCHKSALDWQPTQCSCHSCGQVYARNDNSIPMLITS
jgi:SAM-dependent methyltransferase